VLLIEPAECFLNFIPISVHTALQVLTLLVKIKSIIFKILLGLKLMGKHIIYSFAILIYGNMHVYVFIYVTNASFYEYV